jgi:DNA-binding IclR family transcriptional regulator
MTTNPNQASNPVQTTLTTLDIVERLKELDGAGVTELAENLDLPKSSVHNYLSTLHQRGYVIKEENEFHVSLRFLDLGSKARDNKDIYDIAKPNIWELAEETGELANLMVEEHGEGVYIHRETGEDAVMVDKNVGQRVHLHNTALGKAILAHYPRERVSEVIDQHGLPKRTETTITDEEELFAELERVRNEGIAYDDEERLKGLRCVAAPILDGDDHPVAAVSVSGPIARFSAERFREEVPEAIKNAVNVIELNVVHG